LHLEHPEAARHDDLRSALAAMVLDRHLDPLAVALRRLGPISEKLLRGNSASALLGAALVFDRDRATTSGWQLAHSICADPRLSAAVNFDDSGYRRTSCCLYYRTPHGGLCGDCALSRVPERDRVDRI
jgi:iron complex transport system ATP-binding protein